MPVKQKGENAKAEFGTYNDVTGNQTNVSVTGTNVNVNAQDTSRGQEERRKEVLEELRMKLEPSYTTRSGRKECLEGTRGELTKKIDNWFSDMSGPNVLFLLGGAGTGKTTVATTMADRYRNQLGSEQYFVREQSSPKSILRTIAFGLSKQNWKIAEAVKASLDKFEIQSATPKRTFDMLLHEPLYAVDKDEKEKKDNVLVIIDALDECGDRKSREQYVRLIKEELPKLPARYRFLVTSRPESDIDSEEEEQCIHKIFIEEDPDAENDILRYITDELGRLPELSSRVGWERHAHALSEAANGMFIWAAIAIELIKEKLGEMGLELERLATEKSLSGSLDNLYESILSSSLCWSENIKNNFPKVFSLIMFGKKKLSWEVVDQMLDVDSRSIFTPLRSIIKFNRFQFSPLILFHASLYDYLTSENTRGKDWFIDEEKQKDFIAHLCFDVMKKRLRFNICGLETSFHRNIYVFELKKKVVEIIPPHLRYVCRNWTLHLQDTAFTAELSHRLETFALNRLLFWLEVLTFAHDRIDRRFMWSPDSWKVEWVSLSGVIDWLADKHPQLKAFIQDADTQFYAFFRAILESTPHIYMSFLPLMQQNSVVAQHYMKQVKHGTLARLERVDERPPTMCTDYHDSDLYDSSYSSDGKRIVSATSGGIHVWDTVTGAPTAIPVQEKWRNMEVLKFSSNGERLISKDTERNIVVWDAARGSIIQEQFEGLPGSVLSVAISPTGEYIVAFVGSGMRRWE